jgi:hypothetical protein
MGVQRVWVVRCHDAHFILLCKHEKIITPSHHHTSHPKVAAPPSHSHHNKLPKLAELEIFQTGMQAERG